MKLQHDLPAFLIAIACAPAALFTVLYLCLLPADRHNAANRDFIVYWATGQDLVRHGNPYDPSTISKIEHDAGFEGGASYYMRNTPWALPLAFPLGYFSPTAAALPWSLLMLGLLAASVRILWKLYGGQANNFDWLGYCFPPALYCIILGQTSILLLFGITLFLRYCKSRPFAAGAALWLCSIKPHLFLPFALVLLVWIFVARAWRVMAGAATAFAAGALITTWIDSSAWSQYAFYMRTSVVTHEFTPCFGDLLRDAIRPNAEILALLPAALACLWALAWFWPRRHTWDWTEQGGLLVLISLLVAPFGWIFDQSIALPALLAGVARTSSRILLATLALLYILLESQLLLPRFNLHSAAYLWPAPAWLIWVLCARAWSRKSPTLSPDPSS